MWEWDDHLRPEGACHLFLKLSSTHLLMVLKFVLKLYGTSQRMNWFLYFPLSFKLLTCTVMVNVWICVWMLLHTRQLSLIYIISKALPLFSQKLRQQLPIVCLITFFTQMEVHLSHSLEDIDYLGGKNRVNVMTQFRIMGACVWLHYGGRKEVKNGREVGLVNNPLRSPHSNSFLHPCLLLPEEPKPS